MTCPVLFAMDYAGRITPRPVFKLNLTLRNGDYISAFPYPPKEGVIALNTNPDLPPLFVRMADVVTATIEIVTGS